MSVEQTPERQRSDAVTNVKTLEDAGVPATVQKEIILLGRTHKLEIELTYGQNDAVADAVTVRDAETKEPLLYEDFSSIEHAAAKERTLREVAGKSGRGTVIPDNIEPSLLRDQPKQRGS